MTDPRLGRLIEFDERSRAYPVRTLVAAKKPRSYTWRCDAYLDQGNEGACVGFAWAHEHAAKPKERPATDELGFELYREAQRLDQWPGEDYEGTSVLGGAKAMLARGYLRQYRWAFGLEDALLAISFKGPAVLGINWYRGMAHPDANGFVHPTGPVDGGHAILARGISTAKRAVWLHNSWGPAWGRDGGVWLSWEALGRLLDERGECCVPVVR